MCRLRYISHQNEIERTVWSASCLFIQEVQGLNSFLCLCAGNARVDFAGNLRKSRKTKNGMAKECPRRFVAIQKCLYNEPRS